MTTEAKDPEAGGDLEGLIAQIDALGARARAAEERATKLENELSSVSSMADGAIDRMGVRIAELEGQRNDLRDRVREILLQFTNCADGVVMGSLLLHHFRQHCAAVGIKKSNVPAALTPTEDSGHDE